MQFGPPDYGLKLTETYVRESYILPLKFDSEGAFRWLIFSDKYFNLGLVIRTDYVVDLYFS